MATPQEIATNSTCFSCLPPGAQLQALVYLFGQIAGVTDPQTIIDGAKCYSCIPQGMLMQALVYLADQIAGGGGSGSGVTCGTADPVSAPSGSCGVYYRTDTGALWIWDGSQWVFKA